MAWVGALALVFLLERPLSVENLEEAWSVAARCVSNNVITATDRTNPRAPARRFLLAGGNQYRTIWTRDFAFSVPGALAVGHDQAVRDTLEVLLGLQREDGLFPRQADRTDANIRWFMALFKVRMGFSLPLKGWFETENDVIAIDSNLLIPWAGSLYIGKTHDKEFAQKWFSGAKRGLEYLEKGYLVEGLIGRQAPFADWEDSLARTGRVSMTNILYVLALRGLAEWAEFVGQKSLALEYTSKAEKVTDRLIRFFWIPEKGYLRNYEKDSSELTADANLMAVAYGVVKGKKAEQIMEAMRASPLWIPMPGRATWPELPKRLKSINVQVVQLEAYHDSMYWLWLTALAAIAEQEVGECESYREIMSKAANRIVRDGTIYEVYDEAKGGQDIKPVKRLLYRAERPFTWSSAFYLLAASRSSLCRP